MEMFSQHIAKIMSDQMKVVMHLRQLWNVLMENLHFMVLVIREILMISHIIHVELMNDKIVHLMDRLYNMENQ